MMQNLLRRVLWGLVLVCILALPAWNSAGSELSLLRVTEAAIATDDDEVRIPPPVPQPPPEPPPSPQPPVTVRPTPPPQPEGPPLSVTEARLRNEDKEGNALSDYKISFDYDETRWISYYVKLVNNTGERLRGKLGIRYVEPNGKLKTNSQSPEGFTFEQSIDVQNSAPLSGGWGRANGGTFEPGRHRIEFWWAGKRIHQMTFAVNEPEQPLSITEIKLRNETRDHDPLGDFDTVFQRSGLKYLAYHIVLKNNSSLVQKGQIGVKLFGPEGTLIQGNGSPQGYTFMTNVEINENAQYSQGWGNDAGNSFSAGRHRIEFWWKGKRIGLAAFSVNE